MTCSELGYISKNLNMDRQEMLPRDGITGN